MLKLYDYPQCPFGQKTRIVLAEKQLDYETIVVDLRNVYNPAEAERAGLTYHGIGRGVAGEEAPIEKVA